MKRLITFGIFLILFSISSRAQDPIPPVYPADRFMLDFFSDIWQNTPQDMSTNTINRGINISMFQDFPIGASRFSFAAGFGFTGHNLYSDHHYTYDGVEEFYDFVQIDETLGEIKNNKLSLNYLNIPLELRFRSNALPSTFRVSAGLRPGILVNAHTKTHYTYEDNSSFPDSKNKQHKLDNIQSFQLGVTGRIGYGRVNFYGYFPLTNIFDGNSVEDMSPISVGLSFIIY